MEQVSNEVLPAGFGYAWSDMSYQEKKAEGGQAMVFAMSFFFVFLILVALYESWSLAFQRAAVGPRRGSWCLRRTALAQIR